MIETPKIIQLPRQPTASIRLTIPREEIQEVMGPGIRELNSTISAQGIKATGSWFDHHLKMHPHKFDFEIGIPVASPVAAAGRVKPGIWPKMRAVRTTYQGGYDGLMGAWKQFDDWIEQNGHKVANDLWQCYVVGPESGSPPSKWRTELTRALLS